MENFNNRQTMRKLPVKPLVKPPVPTKSVSVPQSEKQDNRTVFEKIQPLLNFLDFDTLIIPVNQENPVEQMIVSIGDEVEDEEDIDDLSDEEYIKTHRVIQLMFIDDLLKETEAKTDPELTYSYILQFYSVLPVELNSDKFMETHNLLAIYSKLLPIGSFGLDDNGDIYYRYSLITQSRDVDGGLASEILSLINFFLKKFVPTIKTFAETSQTFEEAIEVTEKDFLNMSKSIS